MCICFDRRGHAGVVPVVILCISPVIVYVVWTNTHGIRQGKDLPIPIQFISTTLTLLFLLLPTTSVAALIVAVAVVSVPRRVPRDLITRLRGQSLRVIQKTPSLVPAR